MTVCQIVIPIYDAESVTVKCCKQTRPLSVINACDGGHTVLTISPVWWATLPVPPNDKNCMLRSLRFHCYPSL